MNAKNAYLQRWAVKSLGKWKLDKTIVSAQGRLGNCLDNDELRTKEAAFRRQGGRLGAKRLLYIILQRIYKSMQLHLDDFYHKLGEPSVTRQALSKARKNLNPEFVRGFIDITAEVEVSDKEAETYRGMRVIAVDGSDVALCNSAELKEEFGCSGPAQNAATALASIAFDPFSHVVFDAQMDAYKTDERTLAKRHAERLLELGLSGSLLLFDRWYPSAEFIHFLRAKGFQFVMRLRRKWNVEADAIKTQGWIDVEHEGATVPVRVLKVKLPTGEVETLVTSLNQKILPIREAGNLYFERWKVEVAYDLLKSKLQMENFSGKTKIAVLQDFYATVYLANLAAFAVQEADERIQAKDTEKDLKHPRKANRNRTIAKLREVWLCLLLEPDAAVRDTVLEEILSALVRFPVSIVKGRSPQRKKPRNLRFPIAKKSVL